MIPERKVRDGYNRKVNGTHHKTANGNYAAPLNSLFPFSPFPIRTSVQDKLQWSTCSSHSSVRCAQDAVLGHCFYLATLNRIKPRRRYAIHTPHIHKHMQTSTHTKKERKVVTKKKDKSGSRPLPPMFSRTDCLFWIPFSPYFTFFPLLFGFDKIFRGSRQSIISQSVNQSINQSNQSKQKGYSSWKKGKQDNG
ncbi:hypothetical protein HOY82DRAFT_31737 [Tuber indicum]|nr:hypothetical protein HOY82DRAFT_31737 [Tuber indicum]